MYDQPNDILINLLKTIQSLAPVLSGSQRIESLVKGYDEAVELVKKSSAIKQDLAKTEALSKKAVEDLEKLDKDKETFGKEKSDFVAAKKAATSKDLELANKQKELDKLQSILDVSIAEAKDEKKKAVAMYDEAEKSKKESEELKDQLTKKINALNQIG